MSFRGFHSRVATFPVATFLCVVLILSAASCAAVDETSPPVYAQAGPVVLTAPDGGVEPGQAQPGRWPMRIDMPEGLVTIYQPQLANFDGDKLTGRSAVSIARFGQEEPIFGAAWLESRVSTDRVARNVRILDVTVTRVRFPEGSGVSEQQLTAALRDADARQQPISLSLDQLLSMLDVVQKEKQAVKELGNTPPKIMFVTHPAVLLQYDGQPRLMQEPNSNLMRAVNTPFFVVLDPSSKTYFLKGAGRWFASGSALGPFQQAAQVPQPVGALADSSGYKDPQQPLPDAQAAGLEIIPATDPSEVIWTDGAEEMSPIPSTDLLYVTNTNSDVFLQIDSQQMFVLLSGRWFTSRTHAGPWTFVAPDKLPDDFKRIPPGSEKGDVLAHVPGTQEARDAVADTFIPQTAAIDRRNFEQPAVQYDGDPQFQPVENTQISYAVNTPSSVVLVNRRYYCCANAVWYASAVAVGPWELCTTVPTEIYTLPPSCPIYPVRYCYVYESTPDYVYCGYLPGYVGCYHYGGVVVYGTGYHYSPWIGRHYYERPHTFGFGAHYDAYHSHWGFRVGLSGEAGPAWLGISTGPVVRGSGWFGHGGYRPAFNRTEVNVYNHRTEVNVIRPELHRQEINVYERRRDVHPAAVIRGATARPLERPGVAARTSAGVNRQEQPRNNVYSTPGGDVYRRGVDGWEQRDGNRWVPRGGASSPEPNRAGTPPREAVPAPARSTRPREVVPVRPAAPPPPESSRQRDTESLNRDFHDRVAGEQRERTYSPAPAHSSPPAETRRESPPSNAGPSRGGESRGGNDGGSRGGKK